MSYLSYYDGVLRLHHPTLDPRRIAEETTRICRTIGDGWLDPDNGITRISTDPADTEPTERWPQSCDAVILIEPEGEETWYDWRDHVEQLRQALAEKGIECRGTVRRHSDETYEPDYERLTITPDRCTSEYAWPTFPDGEEW